MNGGRSTTILRDMGLNISRKKTVYKRFNVHRNLDGNSDINLHGDNLERVNGDLDAKMTHIIQSGWKQLEEGKGGSV